MPTSKSAIKRARTAEENRQRNRAVTSEVATARAKLYEALSGGDQANSQSLYRQFCSVLDKAVKKGMLKAGNADRRKSRAALRLATLRPA